MRRSILLRTLPCLLAVGAAAGAYQATAGATPRATAARTAAGCANGQIDSWLNTVGNGTAGTVYYQLQFTNLSRHACSLRGFPGVSAVTIAGQRIGAAASRDGLEGGAVTLAAGATAKAAFGVVFTSNYPVNACKPVTAFGLRVYAPNQTFSDVIPWPFSVCSKASTVSITIQTVVH